MNEKDKAQEIYNAFYMILFDSESDKGQEIPISDLAKKCAIAAVNECVFEKDIDYWNPILHEIEKINT